MKLVLFAVAVLILAVSMASGLTLVDTTGLVAYYPFSGNANDASLHGHDGSVSSAALTFDRGNNTASAYYFTNPAYIQIPFSTELYPATAITIASWIKADSWGPSNNSVFSTASSFPEIGYGLRCEWGAVRFFFSYAGTWVSAATAIGSVTTGQWYLLVGTYNGTTIRLYLNGVQSSSTPCSGTISSSTSFARIGSSVNNGEFFIGSIDDVRLYNRALSDQEVYELYNENVPVKQPMLILPANNAYLNTHTVPFVWNTADTATTYRIQVTIDSTFSSIEHDQIVIAPDTVDMAEGLIYNNYYWRVRSFNASGDSSWWSAIWHFRIDTIPPIAPALISPTNDTVIENQTPWFSWNAVAGVLHYHIDITTDSFFVLIADSTTLASRFYMPANKLYVGQRYLWRVSACDTAGNWSINNQVRRFSIALVIPPALLLPVHQTMVNTNMVELCWSGQDSATGYQVQVSADNTFTGTEVDQFIIAPDTSLSTPQLIYSRYYWRVRAFHDATDTSNWSGVFSFSIDTTPPQTPVLSTPMNGVQITDSLPRFHWSNVPGARRYAIQIAGDSLFTFLEDTALVDTAGYRAAVGLTDGDHYWRVQACDTAENWSVNSAPWTFAVDTYTPVLLTPADGVNWYSPYPDFEWCESRNVSGYQIEISNDSLFAQVLDSTSVTVTSYHSTDSLPDSVYYWRVKAFRGPGDTSGWSERWMSRVATYISHDSLVAWYPFTGNARDSSGNGHHGTVSGAVLTTDRFGNANAAYQFNGGYIQVPYASALNPTQRITVAAWVNIASTGCVSFLSSEQNIPDKGYGLRAGGGCGVFFSSCAGTWLSAETAYGAVTNGHWYYLVGTYDGTAIRLYLDGTLALSSPFTGLLSPSTTDLRIGSNSTGTIFFNGVIDDIRIYQRALTALEVAILYNEKDPAGISTTQTEISQPIIARILTAKPNPARLSTVINYQLSTLNVVRLDFYNVAGQRVATLDQGTRPAGFGTVLWDLRDDRGCRVSNGIYFVRLTAGTQHLTSRVIVVR